jgi:hypothetical protein
VSDEHALGDPAAAAPRLEAEPGTVSLRPVLAVFVVLLLAAAGFAIYSCARAPASGTFVDSVHHYPPDSVTYLASGRSYLVRLSGGSFLALSEVEADAADRQQGCVIRFRADLSADGQVGVFRDDCHGALFNREGIAVQGSAPPMQQHPVQVNGDAVSVNFRSCLGSNSRPEPCRE